MKKGDIIVRITRSQYSRAIIGNMYKINGYITGTNRTCYGAGYEALRHEFRLTTLQEIAAFYRGIKNIYDISKTIKLW